jgi:hypothetical protein
MLSRPQELAQLPNGIASEIEFRSLGWFGIIVE